VKTATDEYPSWCLEFKKRNNNSVKKEEFLQVLHEKIGGRVEFKGSDMEVVIEVFRNLLVCAVVKGYKEMKKFNLQQLIVKDEDKKQEETSG